MQDEVAIREAGADDVALLDAALRALSRALGDLHRAGEAELTRAGFGPVPVFRALLAERAGAVAGVALCSPLFSTIRGKAGVYVSDLWVDEGMRRQGLGERLLAAARDLGAREWGAGFLRLAVNERNRRARGFYERLGFVAAEAELAMTVEGEALEALRRG